MKFLERRKRAKELAETIYNRPEIIIKTKGSITRETAVAYCLVCCTPYTYYSDYATKTSTTHCTISTEEQAEVALAGLTSILGTIKNCAPDKYEEAVKKWENLGLFTREEIKK